MTEHNPCDTSSSTGCHAHAMSPLRAAENASKRQQFRETDVNE